MARARARVKTTKSDSGKMARLEKEMQFLRKHGVEVGFFGTGDGWSGGEETDLVDIAVFNEFGTETIPARPFMRQTSETKGDDMKRQMATQAEMIVDGNRTAYMALKLMGMTYANAVQNTIENGNFTPNAPATIAKKKSDKPLIDKGIMKNSVRWVVVPKK